MAYPPQQAPIEPNFEAPRNLAKGMMVSSKSLLILAQSVILHVNSPFRRFAALCFKYIVYHALQIFLIIELFRENFASKVVG